MSDPLVSIVIPAYNAERTVGGAISAALQQSYPRVEIVVVDDGSTDRTAEVAHAYGSQIRVVSKPNGGVSSARNAGIAAAAGEFVVQCDADDLLLPPYVQACMDVWRSASGGRRWVTSDGYLLTAGGIDPRRKVLAHRRVTGDAQRLAILQGNFATCFSLLPAAMLQEIGGYDESLATCEDWDLWMRAILHGWQAEFQNAPHGLYRWTPGGLSSQVQRMLDGEEQMLQKLDGTGRHLLRPAEAAYLDRRLAQGNPRELYTRGDHALRAGDLATARRLYIESAPLIPADYRLQAKTWSMRLLPAAGHFWRRRLLAADRATGRDVNPR